MSFRQVWLLKGKKDDMYRAMWEKAMDEVAAQLIFNKGGLTYIAELNKCARLCCCAACCRAPGSAVALRAAVNFTFANMCSTRGGMQ
jgi:hypothetical protein